jgi:hypothetical protein
MIKHALAVALLGIGLGFLDQAPVHAAPPLSALAASPATMAGDTAVKVGLRCLDEVPVVQGVVAFFQLLRNDEIENCYSPRDGEYADRNTDVHPTYKDEDHAHKDRGHAQPKDLKETPR